jgi:nucleotide-binding universal stress UspA family protein
MAEILVGIDGSQHARIALQLAADEARWRSARLHIVHVYTPVRTSRATTAAMKVASELTTTVAGRPDTVLREASRRDDEEREEGQRHAESRMRQFVSESGADLHGLDVEQTAVSDEHPAAALLRLSQRADLLVVGSRGVGGFVGLLLGSVGQQCVHHASCPVLIAR